MNHALQSKRFWLLQALFLPVALTIAATALQAQSGAPRRGAPVSPTGPTSQPRCGDMLWSCSRCQLEVGQGAAPPGRCPYCGAVFINGGGSLIRSGGWPKPNGHRNDGSGLAATGAPTISPLAGLAVLIGGGVALVAAASAAVAAIWLLLRSRALKKSPHRSKHCQSFGQNSSAAFEWKR
jgi:hypothetical protein